ncbi:MAG: FAD-dependent monooxygenase [Pseudomonadota bacterium]
MKIAIAGAGIAGLASAALLARAGHEVEVFDQFPEPRPVGSGLMIQPIGLRVLKRLGLDEDARAQASPIARVYGETVAGRKVLDTNYADLRDDVYGFALQRAALFDLLLQAARDAGAILTQDTAITGGRSAWLSTEEDTLGPFDLVLDCLGAYSPLCPRPSKPLAYGALWGLFDWPSNGVFHADWLEQRYRHASRMVGVLPVGQRPGEPRKLTFFYSMKSSDEPAWRARSLNDWKDEVRQIWRETGPVLDQIRSHDDLVFAQYTHHTVAYPAQGRIAHLGDSHHATSPQLGQGANTALLDAAAVADALARKTDLTGALNAYEQARWRHVWIYQTASWAFTPLYQSDSRILPWVRDRIAAPLSRVPPMPRILAKLVAGEFVDPGVN